MEKAIDKLVQNHVPSRVYKQDYSLFDFDDNALGFAKNYMGWTDLALNPPVNMSEITNFAHECWGEGINSVYLIGMGGSSQAPMTVTKFNKASLNKTVKNRVKFRVLDSTSPVRIRKALQGETFENALVIVSSKSGGTLEPRMILSAVRDIMVQFLPEDQIVNHFVAITDPGSNLEKQAHTEGWRSVFLGKPSVGGRFSALSVFGLVPIALAGVDIERFIQYARQAEELCSADNVENPAIKLASFLYENYSAGRDKFCFLSPVQTRTLGLWIEQLVAESLGKQGKGILPCLEVNPSLQSESCLTGSSCYDRSFVIYRIPNAPQDEIMDFEQNLSALKSDVPRIEFEISSVEEMAKHFVVWEYAVTMCGYLMQVCPFDQPDVQSAKTKVIDIIGDGATAGVGLPKPAFVCEFKGLPDLKNADKNKKEKCLSGGNDASRCSTKNSVADSGLFEVNISQVLIKENEQTSVNTLQDILYNLIDSIKIGDYFAINAFLPFEGDERVRALEHMRAMVARKFGVVSILEIGPRFLHSSGQLHKGGPNKGVFLILSGDEVDDIKLDEPCETLGHLAKAQAVGDWQVLSERDRRAVYIHLPNNSSSMLWKLAFLLDDVLSS